MGQNIKPKILFKLQQKIVKEDFVRLRDIPLVVNIDQEGKITDRWGYKNRQSNIQNGLGREA